MQEEPYEILVPGDPGSHGPFRDFWEIFGEKLDFSCRNNYIIAKAHARGFFVL